MPLYEFMTDDGRVVTYFYPADRAPRIGERVCIRGNWVTRILSTRLHTPPPGNWPMYSDALGVHPDQIEEARAHAEACGVPTDFTPDGRAILRSPKHRKLLARTLAMHDRNAGPSDPTPDDPVILPRKEKADG